MPMYLIVIDAENPQEVIVDLVRIAKQNAIKGVDATPHSVVMQYGGGGAKRLHELLRPATINRCRMAVFKLAGDYALADFPDPCPWIDDAAHKGAF